MSTITKKTISKAALKDITELEEKIKAFKAGEIPEDRFKAFRLTRGVYGQRQPGVQMFRLKIPYGRITPRQLRTVAHLSEQYATGNIHLTTRQNIQLHHVKVEDTPRMWESLELSGLTAREACGNTVRNITASALAGIDPHEPFDVTPYVQAVFEFFLRNPICQDMGRKVKIAFSSSEHDSAFTFIHDLGFIPVLRQENGLILRGFKVVVGGGLGAQAILALTYTEFLPEDKLITFIEAVLRVFDRFGEREKRMKARMKYLIKSIGLTEFRKLVENELLVIREKPLLIKTDPFEPQKPTKNLEPAETNQAGFENWLNTNVLEQKQQGYYAVQVRVPLGNIDYKKAIELADFVEQYLGTEFRITVNQGLIIHHIEAHALPAVYQFLKVLGFGLAGFDRLADVTSCPGTDTCNLAVTNSTALSLRLEEMMVERFPALVHSQHINIKISGCMNSCGQHMIAGIGFHGSSIKNGLRVIPAMQVVLGGGVNRKGEGLIAEKVIKLPTRRIPDAVAWLLQDYLEQATADEFYPEYFNRKGKPYFYALLKPLADLSAIKDFEFTDWDSDNDYLPEIGVGECAGVSFDLVSSILADAEEKLQSSREYLAEKEYAHALYQSYNVLITAAKALLLNEEVHCNTQAGIVKDLDLHFVSTGKLAIEGSFESLVNQITGFEPQPDFALYYHQKAEDFLHLAKAYRSGILHQDKLVINHFYKA
jgi:sulfite reductase (ferredoxin)